MEPLPHRTPGPATKRLALPPSLLIARVVIGLRQWDPQSSAHRSADFLRCAEQPGGA